MNIDKQKTQKIDVYKNCLEAAQIQNKITHLEKIKLSSND